MTAPDPDRSADPLPSEISGVRRWSMVLGVMVAVIALDQLTKRWALDRLWGGEIIDVIGSLRLRLAFNTGMAFSKGSGSGAIIGLVALGIVVVLVLVARRIRSRPQLVLIGIVMGGALGNIIDRVMRVGEVNPFTGVASSGFMSGAVVDFIDLQWWPVFNVADAAVVCGGIALAILSARAPAEPPAPDPSTLDGADGARPPDDSSDVAET